MAAPEEKRMDEVLSQQVRSAADEAESFKSECSKLGKRADRLAQMLRSLARLTASAPSLYERPIRCVATEASRNLEQALALARNFRKIRALLDASLGNLKWLLSVFDTEGEGVGIEVSLPPVVSNEPILAWAWSFIASLHMGPLPVRIEAANRLASLARNSDRNKMIIVDLKESSAPDAQAPEGEFGSPCSRSRHDCASLLGQ
ncbi:hypothetical protein ACJRO7_014666 [Eucalyptus globulus]|uniref:DUF7792 domain-containing protein n=1 Tax=Eucalyptus globulus TaxID=34317 RepID=A0ABD3L1Q1_EUCGL